MKSMHFWRQRDLQWHLKKQAPAPPPNWLHKHAKYAVIYTTFSMQHYCLLWLFFPLCCLTMHSILLILAWTAFNFILHVTFYFINRETVFTTLVVIYCYLVCYVVWHSIDCLCVVEPDFNWQHEADSTLVMKTIQKAKTYNNIPAWHYWPTDPS